LFFIHQANFPCSFIRTQKASNCLRASLKGTVLLFSQRLIDRGKAYAQLVSQLFLAELQLLADFFDRLRKFSGAFAISACLNSWCAANFLSVSECNLPNVQLRTSI
jgi:hypothetical protein